METSLYVALSGQLALERRLDTVANNVANSNTPGFRAENITFESILSRGSVAYSNEGKTSFSRQAGSLVQTDNPLDVALQGNAYMAIGTANGAAYTRDGRMRVSANGDLETLTGHPVFDSGGAPIQINLALGPVEIARNGAISQNGNRIGQIGLFRLPEDASLARGPDVSVVPDKPAEPLVDFNDAGVVQGYIEGSNVNPILEMTRLIAVSRAFESLSASIDQSDRKLNEAIGTLASGRRG
ncbi:MAG: flagellar basal-body rod protein FlgF [Hyphomicrobiaceae bacterium]